MRERKSDIPPPWHVPRRGRGCRGDRPALRSRCRCGRARRGGRIAGLRDLPRLEANFDVTRHGAGGLHVAGRVSATVGQNCVVTLEPLANEVEEDIDLFFVPQPVPKPPSGESESQDEPREVKWNDPEPLIGGVVDLGALATEFLILGLDPYPRKPGAVFEPPQDAKPDARPFRRPCKIDEGPGWPLIAVVSGRRTAILGCGRACPSPGPRTARSLNVR